VKDLFDHPAVQHYLARAEREMLPMLADSAVSVTIFSGKVDIKLCVEMGAAVLLDKPIIIVVCGSEPVPANVRRVASAIIEGETSDPAVMRQLQDAITRVLAEDRRVRQ
jgi:hypothetical protein